MKEIAHLHCHTEFSLLKGVGSVDDWYQKASKRGITALALTEHGNMGSTLASFLAAKDTVKAAAEKKKLNPVKCIIGMQALVVQDVDSTAQEERIVLLAKNEKGYKNLLKLSKFSWTKGYDTKRQTARISYKALAKRSDGLICLTGSLSGPVAVSFEAGFDVMRLALRQLHSIFGKDLYAEIQLNETVEQKTYNKALIIIAREFGIPLVVTNDCHYISKGDDKLREVVRYMQQSRKSESQKDHKEISTQKWLKTYEQLNTIRERMHGYITQSMFDKMVDTANTIAAQCNVDIPIGHHSLPSYDVPSHDLYEDGMNAKDLFMKIARTGFKEKVEKNTYRSKNLGAYKKRFKYEVGVISDANFIDYFLIVEDIIRWAKNNDVEVGAARGSVAGSLVAFCMDITDIDPIRFDLMFERFLNPTRVSGERAKSADALPDIDIDFERTRRPDVKRYIIEKYGADSVCTIGSYQTMKVKSLLRTLHKYFDGNLPVDGEGKTDEISKQDIEKLCRYLENSKINDLEKAEKDNEFKKFMKRFPYFVKFYCHGLDEQIRATSRHAAGVLVTPTKLTDWIPVRTQKVEDEEERVLVSQWEDIHCERRGLLKLDILGIKMLDVFKYARQMIQKRHGVTIDIRDMEEILDDKKVLKLFGEGETAGVFQYNSRLQSSYLKELGRVTFEDLIVANAALRPGPMDADAHKLYIALKHKEETPHYDHPILKPDLKKTLGLYIYQEQVMLTAHLLGGLTLAQADIMRSAIKKKDKGMISAFRGSFVKGCVEKGKTEKQGGEIWDKLIAFSTYGFNRSHSASYAYLGFFCQWIKAYYPIEFWTAVLEFADDDVKSNEHIWIFREPILRSGIKILDPKATRRDHRFHIVKDKIAWPIRAIKGVGIKAAVGIADACKQNKPQDLKEFYDCVPRRVVNKRVFNRLIAADAFRNFGTPYVMAKKYYKVIRRENIPKELDLDKNDLAGWERLKDEALGYMTESYKERYSDWFSNHVSTVEDLKNTIEDEFLIMGGKVVRTYEHKGYNGIMMFVTVEDVDGKFLVFIAPGFLKSLEKKPKVGDIVELFGRKGFTKRDEDELVLNSKDCELEIYDGK